MDSHIDPERFDGQVEARSVAFSDLEVTRNGRHFDGYAAVYDQEADLGAFLEVVRAPALDVGLRNTGNLPMVWDHNMTMPPFATTDAGTLSVSADRRGLRVQTDIDERHILGPTLISMAERGELKGMSIGFVTDRGHNKISHRGDRMLRSIVGYKKFLDVSPTWNPAYTGTSAELRSLAALQSAPVLVPEQRPPSGESQQQGDGPDQETTEVMTDPEMGSVDRTCEKCGVVLTDDEHDCTTVEEQRSGVDADASAARRRRLQMLGMTLPNS